MTEEQEEQSVARIETARRIGRKAVGACMQRAGVTTEEAAIGSLYATFDVAELHVGAGMPAIEWLRSAADVLERQILTGQRNAH